jgi:hypothetical protein
VTDGSNETIRHVGEAIEHGEGHDVYSIGLTTTTEVDDDTFALIFSIAEPDDGDGYSLVVEPGQRCAYRCVESCRLRTDRLQLELSGQAPTELGLPRDLSVALELPESDLMHLRRGLVRVGIVPV